MTDLTQIERDFDSSVVSKADGIAACRAQQSEMSNLHIATTVAKLMSIGVPQEDGIRLAEKNIAHIRAVNQEFIQKHSQPGDNTPVFLKEHVAFQFGLQIAERQVDEFIRDALQKRNPNKFAEPAERLTEAQALPL